MADEIDDLTRQAIAQRVAGSRAPRPYEALEHGADATAPQRWRFPPMSSEHTQRGALIAAIAAVTLLVVGGLAAGSIFGRDRPSDLAADSDGVETTPVPVPDSVRSTTTLFRPVETTLEPIDDEVVVSTEPGVTNPPGDPNLGLYTIEYRCESGSTGSIEVLVPFGRVETPGVVITIPAADDIGAAVNTESPCTGAGPLIEITFDTACGSEIRMVRIAAVDGAVPDVATLDICE
ncbi:MAG: hypothetical protein AAF467_15660 [Actinomycetota bacterium]